jgi:hypothetical protein
MCVMIEKLKYPYYFIISSMTIINKKTPRSFQKKHKFVINTMYSKNYLNSTFMTKKLEITD